MNENQMKMVMFNEYCPKCEHEETDENKQPCEDCVSEFVRGNDVRRKIKICIENIQN